MNYFRNALDEEQRAQKALYLLQARDRRIALLEKRVAELEDAATNLHELTLRNSSRGSTLDSTSEKVRSYNEASCKSECDFEDVNSTGRGGNVARGPREDRESAANGRVSVPCLDLSKSSESASDIFSTAIDFVMEKSKCFPSNTSFSVEEEATEREEFNEGENLGNSKSEVKIAGSSSNVGSSRKEDSGGVGGNRSEFENKNKDCVGMGGRSEEKVRGNKYQRSNFPRLTSSVPWIRAKHSFRKKLRGYELKTGKRIKDVSYGDGHLAFAAFQ